MKFSTWPAMCRGVGQASHIMSPLSAQQWWVPGGTRKYKSEFLYQGCKLWNLLNSRGYHTINILIYIYISICIGVNVIQWLQISVKKFGVMKDITHHEGVVKWKGGLDNETDSRSRFKGCSSVPTVRHVWKCQASFSFRATSGHPLGCYGYVM